MQKTIFAVDDSLTNLAMVEEALENQYLVITLSSAEKMFAALQKLMPDLILLDIAMPGLSGLEAMKQLRSNKLYAGIPVIFLTALADSFNEALGLELGAVDFITKPFSASVLLNRIKNHLNIDEIVRERTEQLVRLKNGLVFTLGDIVECRDQSTGGHIERTTIYLRILLDAMMAHGVYDDEIRDCNLEKLISSARLHDLGKIFVPDAILNKPGPLTADEFQTVKAHTTDGEKIIDQMIYRTGEVEFLHCAKLIATFHHERWDGTGYPYGLKGTQIPLHGRLMAIIDVYDALISERPYKEAFTHETAVQTIRDEAGKHFDPLIAGVFHEINEQFKMVN